MTMTTDRGLAAAGRARLAAERAALAAERGAAVRGRLDAVAAGRNPSSLTLVAARAAYDQSTLLVAASRRRAALAFAHSADAHRAAADAALARGNLDRAQQQVDLAAADDLSGAALAKPA